MKQGPNYGRREEHVCCHSLETKRRLFKNEPFLPTMTKVRENVLIFKDGFKRRALC